MPVSSYWECTAGLIDVDALQDKLTSLFKRKLSFNLKNLLDELGEDLLSLLESGFDAFQSQMLANLTNLVPNAGLLFVSALTSGQQSYLGFHAFVYTLFIYELQRRIVILRSLLGSLNDIEFVLDLLLNSKIYGSTDSYKEIDTAYQYIKRAHIKIGEVTNTYNTSGFYRQSSVNTANTNLNLAKQYLNTPVLDIIGPLIRNADFGNGWVNASMDAYNDPQDMWAAMVGTTQARQDFKTKVEAGDSRTSQERRNESRVLFQNAVLEYLDMPITVAKLEQTIVEMSQQIAEDLPLNASGFTGAITALTDLGSKAKFEDLVDVGKEKRRPLLNLNKSIKYRYYLMSVLGTAWDGMISLKEFTGKRFDATYAESVALEEDVRGYMESPGSTTLVPIKMADWKLRIESIQSRLETITSVLGEQTISIDTANQNLDTVNALIQTKLALYKNDNKYTPESEGAFYLLTEVLTGILTSFGKKDRLIKLKNTIAEAKKSLRNAVADDFNTIEVVNTFVESVLEIPGMQAQIELLDSLLDSDEYSNSFMKDLVDQVKTGDLTVAINAALATVGDIAAITDTIVAVSPAIAEAVRDYKECVQTANTADEARRKAEQAEAQAEKDAEAAEDTASEEAELNSEIEETEGAVNTATNPTEDQKKKVSRSDQDAYLKELEAKRKEYGLSQEDMF